MNTQENIDLTEDDIDGASFGGRDPSHFKKSEILHWLKCRNISLSKNTLKSTLEARVRSEIVSGRSVIVDPSPDGYWIQRKRQKISGSSSSPASVVNIYNTKSADQVLMQVKSKFPTSDFSTSLKDSPKPFTDSHIQSHARKSGRLFEARSQVDKPLQKGYKFFQEQYVCSFECTWDASSFFIKSKCHKSMKKNEKPYDQYIMISRKDSEVQLAHCVCPAGSGGYCNHIIAVLYYYSHCTKMEYKEVPENCVCTEMPCSWMKPRGGKIKAEPVMDATVLKPGDNRKRNLNGVQCTLYEARASEKMNNPIKINNMISLLQSTNSKMGFSYIISPESTSTEATKLGCKTPRGSYLSYQLGLNDSDDFSVCCDLSAIGNNHLCGAIQLNMLPKYPDFPMKLSDELSLVNFRPLQQSYENFLDFVFIDKSKSIILEHETIKQSDDKKWHDSRQFRLTSSRFGEIVKHVDGQKNLSKYAANLLTPPKNLANVPSLKWGRVNEINAITAYKTYMKNIGREVRVESTGLIVNPDFPWLGCSPDSKVTDPHAVPSYGLLEVKCPYSSRNITPVEASLSPVFYCKSNEKSLNLKIDSNYYFQVQGQMLVTGAKWCDFVVWTEKGLSVQRIPYNHQFSQQMLSKLSIFYFEYFLDLADKKWNELNMQSDRIVKSHES